MTKKLIEIASEIVQTQISLTPMTTADINLSLRQVFSTLQEMQKAETGGIVLAPTAEVAGQAPTEEKPVLSPANSIQNDKVICLECGAVMRQLTSKHLISHSMSQKEYKKKYGFTMRTPLAAKALTKARSKAAKKRGLPEKLQKYMEARRQMKAEAAKPMAPENSIQDDKVICLECGAEFKQLTQKHLVSHGMDQREYRKKYGFSMQTPLAAKSLIQARQKTAKEKGLPEKLKQYQETRRQAKAEATTQAVTEKAANTKPNRTKLRKKKVA